MLGQQACAAESDETTAIPLLLDRLATRGALVTIDAQGCQTKVAQKIPDKGADDLLAAKTDWPNLHAEVARARNTSRERRSSLRSLPLEADLFSRAVREHWHIENRLHWMLDVVFHEDLSRLRTGHGPQNMATVHHAMLNLLRGAKDNHSLKVRRKSAARDDAYREIIIRQTA